MTKCYLVKLSDKTEISIDGDEVQTVVAGITSGSIVQCKQGMFNPSFFVALVEDEDRLRDLVTTEGKMGFTGEGKNMRQEWIPGTAKELKPLRDIFADMKLLK